MKIKFLMSFVMILLIIPETVTAQKKKKKTQHFTVTHVINAPADEVWKVVGEDYGAIANSHPKIVSSEYINGSLKAGEGAERICNFNEKGTRFLKEKQVEYNPEEYSFKNQLYQADKFPLNSDYTYAIYKVEPIDENTSRFIFDMTFRTKPAFMGWMAKGKFKKLIADYAIAIEHHVNTGEKVTKDNFRTIKRNYRKTQKEKRKNERNNKRL
jgi:hypothetical protein